MIVRVTVQRTERAGVATRIPVVDAVYGVILEVTVTATVTVPVPVHQLAVLAAMVLLVAKREVIQCVQSPANRYCIVTVQIWEASPVFAVTVAEVSFVLVIAVVVAATATVVAEVFQMLLAMSDMVPLMKNGERLLEDRVYHTIYVYRSCTYLYWSMLSRRPLQNILPPVQRRD